MYNVDNIVCILRDEFYLSIEDMDEQDTEKAYGGFVQHFAKQNNMKIYGELSGGIWCTKGYAFHSEEDELIFKLKYR